MEEHESVSRREALLEEFKGGCGTAAVSDKALEELDGWTRAWLAGENGPDPRPVWKDTVESLGITYGELFRLKYREIGKKARSYCDTRHADLKSAGADVAEPVIEPDDVVVAFHEVKKASADPEKLQACPFCPTDP